MSIESNKLMNLADGQVLYNDLRNRVKTKAPVILATASGSIASFNDGADNLPIEHCVVNIDPVQDLHGQDNPYPAGGGKNIGVLSTTNVYSEQNCTKAFANGGVSVTATAQYGRAGFSIPVTNGETYTISYKIKRTDSSLGTVGIYYGSTEGWSKEYGNVSASGITDSFQTKTLTFTATSDVFTFGVYTSTEGQTLVIKEFQIELGSSATAYAPYSNICPITGWTGMTVKKAGKNLLAPVFYKGVGYNPTIGAVFNTELKDPQPTDNHDGTFTITISSAWQYYCLLFPVKQGKTYRFKMSCSSTGNLGRTVGYLDKDFKVISKDNTTDSSWNYEGTLNPSGDPKRAYWFVVITNRSTTSATITLTNPQSELGSVSTDYEPYKGTTYPVSWQTEAGTVYGGNLDVVTGLLTVDKIKISVAKSGFNAKTTGIQMDYHDSLTQFSPTASGISWATARQQQISNMARIANPNTESTYGNYVAVVYTQQNTSTYARLRISDYLYEMMSENDSIDVCYQLAEPQTYQLTPVQIASLLGENNVWGDTGDSTVQYRADTKMYVDQNEVGVTDVKVNNTSVVTNGVANIPLASTSDYGVAKINTSYGIKVSSGVLQVSAASDANIKSGNQSYNPITTAKQHQSVFYGLAKASGDTSQASSSNAVGTYTDEAKQSIQTMLGMNGMIAPVEDDVTSDNAYAIGDLFCYNGKLYQVTAAIAIGDYFTPNTNCVEVSVASAVPHDVQVNGTSVVTNGVANVPVADSSNYGTVKVNGNSRGVGIGSDGTLTLETTTDAQYRIGTNAIRAVMINKQHVATFYGLAKAAGDSTMASSSNALGTYTESALSAISQMLNAPVAVSGTTPTINAMAGVRYVCGEVTSLSFTPSASGDCEVIFGSGSTPAVLTVPSTVKFPEWFDATALEENRTYDIIITNGTLGVVTSWA